MPNKDLKYLKGHFIIAMPGLPDSNFAQSVICVCDHNNTGALGFVINKIHPLLTGRELFDNLNIDCNDNIDKIKIYLGGPVQQNRIFVLHGPPFHWHGCMQITSKLGLTNTKNILKALAKGKGPELFMIILGCAGWEPLQLDNEIRDNVWISCPISEQILFNVKTDMRWEETMIELGTNQMEL